MPIGTNDCEVKITGTSWTKKETFFFRKRNLVHLVNFFGKLLKGFHYDNAMGPQIWNKQRKIQG
jgi:hypothetical protein